MKDFRGIAQWSTVSKFEFLSVSLCGLEQTC